MLAPFPTLAKAETIDHALLRGARVVYSLSGGKDSSAAAFETNAYLDSIGHPPDRRHSIHADLGTIEWRSTPAFVAEVAGRLETDLDVVSRKAGGLIQRWQQRWRSSIARYVALETYQLVSPFSSANLRFCTSEQKVAPIGAHLKSRFAGETIISVVGIRREESSRRAKAPIFKLDTRFAPHGNKAGTTMLTWHPILEWTESQVYDAHARRGFPLHEAYHLGATRLSCSYCVLASIHNLAISANAPGNHQAYGEIVAIELASGFSFQPGRWLADVAPDLLQASQRALIPAARRLHEERRRHEALMPADLRFCRGWPPRIPDPQEAATIAGARGDILASLNLPNRYPTGADVRDRFAFLHTHRHTERS